MIDFKSAAFSAIFLGIVSTLGDLVWALWIPRHRPIYGLVHGAIICLCIGLAIGVRGGRVTLGAAIGPVVGLIAAAGFYALARLAGLAAMFPMWMLFWILFGILEGRLRGEPTSGGPILRGVAAAVLSGAAFYAISGIWLSRRPGGPNYGYNLAAWTFAFFPGFAALFAGSRSRSVDRVRP